MGSADFIHTQLAVSNSTVQPLGAGLTFTGTTNDVAPYSKITIMAFSDQASAVNGLVLQFSSDAENWDYEEYYTLLANTPKVVTADTVAQFFRIKYINGDTQQGSFRLQTRYSWYHNDILTNFKIPSYDYIGLTYVDGGNGDGEIETVTYRKGGSTGDVVGMLVLTYDASNRIDSVTKV